MRLGKFRSALDDAVVALQIDPEDRDAANLLAELHTSLSSGGTICDGGAFNRTAVRIESKECTLDSAENICSCHAGISFTDIDSRGVKEDGELVRRAA
eukprot:SAG31_NODE_2175_length_6246_cov_6.380380_4_plen_98_part_00